MEYWEEKGCFIAVLPNTPILHHSNSPAPLTDDTPNNLSDVEFCILRSTGDPTSIDPLALAN
jgi:hypothetical protein